MAKSETKTSSEKFGAFLEKHKKAVICCFSAVIVLLVAFVVFEALKSKQTQRNLDAVDVISYELTDGSVLLEDEAVAARLDTALVKLAQYTKKSGVAGVRANLLAAEVSYQKKDYESAVAFWDAAAAKGKRAYTAPLAYFNKASCLEELGRLDEAAESYKKASDFPGFILASHAKFNYGRVLEATGDYSGAVQAYKDVNDFYPDDTWSDLAKTRLISLELEGKAE